MGSADVDVEDRVRVRFVAFFAVVDSGESTFFGSVAGVASSALVFLGDDFTAFFAVDFAAAFFAVDFVAVDFIAVDFAAVDFVAVFFAVDLAAAFFAVAFFAAGLTSAEASERSADAWPPWGGPAGREAARRRGRAVVVDESWVVRGSWGVESWSTMRVVPFAGRG